MSTRTRLGVPSVFYTKPLTVHLAERDLFARQVDVPAQHAVRLREHELDAAFLTPIDYARDSSEYRIVPGVGVSSASATGSISLVFHDEIQTVNTVAIDPSSSSEIILAKIILAEEYELEPKFQEAYAILLTEVARSRNRFISPGLGRYRNEYTLMRNP